MHRGIKPHKCDVCRKMFAHTGHLKIHAWTHPGEKQYQFEVGKKRFTHLHNFQKHSRIHTGKKIKQCALCNKMFHIKFLSLWMRRQSTETEKY